MDFYKALPDFNKVLTCEGTFPAETFFNYEKFREFDVYMKYVKDDEKYGPGGMNRGVFFMNQKFHITLITNHTDKDMLDKFISGLPDPDQFLKVIITADWAFGRCTDINYINFTKKFKKNHHFLF